MAQTIQIVPKWSYPYVETHINDYTQIASQTITDSTDSSVKMAFAVHAPKGIDNVWVRKTTMSSAIKSFGNSNFKKYGQPYMQALNVLKKDNSQVWIMRVMPENATFANAVVSAFYKADTAETVPAAHERKFRVKIKSKSVPGLNLKTDLVSQFTKFDGDTIKVDGETVYKDAEGFIQVPFMTVNYTGRGTCGNSYSLRMSQAFSYEKQYGVKMYNFEALTSETSIVKDANYVGGIVSSAKYGAEGTTLINDILNDVEIGIAPIDIMVHEDNVETVYDKYVDFLKKLNADLKAEYDEKLDEYGDIPEDQLNGTAPVEEKYKDKIAMLSKIDNLIEQTSVIPSNDEFDLIFGIKVASSDQLPCFVICKTLDDTVDTSASDYDSKMYTNDKVVDFQSAKGLVLESGTNGYFDQPRTDVINGESVKRTFNDELTECYVNAFNGVYDRKILSPRRVGITAFFDANYPMEVKRAIVDLCNARFDCRTYLDAGIINTLTPNIINKLIQDYSVFNNPNVSVDIHNYITREYSTNKRINVTISYFLSAQYVDHLTNVGYHVPFCKEYAELTGHVRDSLKPVIEEYDGDIKEILNNNRLNYFECITENVFQRSTQNTTQKTSTDLTEENNATIANTIKAMVEADAQGELYNFADESIRISFINYEKAKYRTLEGRVVEKFDIAFKTSEYEFEHSILHCYVSLTFRGINKQAIVEIDLNKRTYQGTTEK